MDIESIKNLIPAYAKDLKLNFSSVLTAEGSPGLTKTQILATAYASSIAARNSELRRHFEKLAMAELPPNQLNAAQAAASIMAMNNIYYRATHMLSNTEYLKMQAKLRMNVIANPGVDKVDFEIYSLAVSAINGCGMCLSAHEAVVRKAAITAEGVQSALRIAAVVHGLAVAIEAGSSAQSERQAA